MGQALATGDVIRGKYRLEQVLGKGGMGTVHLASHLVIGQRVAIKIVNPSPEQHEYVVARFLREARAAALLESDHVVRILDVDATEDGAPFMVMEYLHGSDLGAISRKGGRLPVPEAVGYVLEACEALAEAHAAGIVHRDLKPSNLFRAETSRSKPVIKLLDFGISKLNAPGEDLSLTDTQAVMGSPLFMSPEQLLSSRDVDLRSDIWSIGVTLYKLVSGAFPFEASSASAVGAQIAAKAPRPLSESFPEAPEGLEGVVMRCLERAPADRYADIAAFARALLPFCASEAEGREAIGAVERAAERGARGRRAPVEVAAPAATPEVEVSGERWTQSQVAQPSADAEISHARRAETGSHKPAARGETETGPATPVVVVQPRKGRAGIAIAILVGVVLVGIIGVIAARGWARKNGSEAATSAGSSAPMSAAAGSSTSPGMGTGTGTGTGTGASANPSTSTSTSTSTRAAASAPSGKAPARPRGGTKPGGNWSKDPSELELK